MKGQQQLSLNKLPYLQLQYPSLLPFSVTYFFNLYNLLIPLTNVLELNKSKNTNYTTDMRGISDRSYCYILRRYLKRNLPQKSQISIWNLKFEKFNHTLVAEFDIFLLVCIGHMTTHVYSSKKNTIWKILYIMWPFRVQ